DTIFGPETRDVLKKFQQDFGLDKVDGLAGPETLGRMDELLSTPSTPPPRRLPVPEPLPPKQKTVRRIVHRVFQKTETSGNLSTPGEDASKESGSALIDLLLGAVTSEGSLAAFESLSARKIADVPENHRVNIVVIDNTLTFEVTISGQVTTNDSNI